MRGSLTLSLNKEAELALPQAHRQILKRARELHRKGGEDNGSALQFLLTDESIPATVTCNAFSDMVANGTVTLAATDPVAFRSELLAAVGAIGAKLTSRAPSKPNTRNGESMSYQITRDRRDTIAENMACAMLWRHDPQAFGGYRDRAREYVGMSLLDMAKESLEACGVNVRGLGRDQIAALAVRGESFGGGAETSTDFPGVLANVANKSLRQSYQAWPQTFKAFSRQVSASDFKDVNRPQLNDAPALQQLNEKGEYHRANLTDQNQNYRLATFGEIVSITRKTIINDDLRAFTRIPQQLGVAAAELESNVAWAVITGNQVMQADNKTLFHSAHNNLFTGGTSALGETSLGASRAAMRTQKAPAGTPLNLVPRFIATPAALETTMNQLVYPINIASSDVTKVVPDWVRSLVPVVEPRLDTASTTAWYLFADPAQIDTLEYCYLEGQDGVYIETKPGFNTDGIEIKARLDFAAAALDYRGLQKNAGV
jgi:hypothetical protein